METNYSLTNFLGKEKYPPISTTNYSKIMMHPHFIRDIEARSIITIFKVGFIEMRRRIVSSSRALAIIDAIEIDISQYIYTLHKTDCATEDLTDENAPSISIQTIDYIFILCIYILYAWTIIILVLYLDSKHWI